MRLAGLLALAAIGCVHPEPLSRTDECGPVTDADRSVPLLDLEDAVDLGSQVEPRITFGARSSIAVEAEGENHFLRVQYEKLAGAPTGAAAQSSYKVTLPYQRVSAGAKFLVRYRSRGVESAVLSLSFLDQKVVWRLNPSGASDWVQACLPLDSRFEKDPMSSPLAALSITSYSIEPSSSRATYFDLDDLRLLESPDGDRNLNALQKRVEADNGRRASIDAAIELRNVRTSRRRYIAGDPVVLTFEIRNGSDGALRIPRDRTGSSGYPLVTTQVWIEPLDAAARETDFGLAARRAGEFAAGGEIRFLERPVLGAGQKLTFSQGLRDLAPGRYRATVEIGSIAESRILAAQSASFEVAPAR